MFHLTLFLVLMEEVPIEVVSMLTSSETSVLNLPLLSFTPSVLQLNLKRDTTYQFELEADIFVEEDGLSFPSTFYMP